MQSTFIPIRRLLLLPLLIFIISLFTNQILAKDKMQPLSPIKDSTSIILQSIIADNSLFFLDTKDSIVMNFIEENKKTNSSLQKIDLLYALGRKYFDQSRYSDAQHIFQEIITKGDETIHWKIIAGCHNYLSLIAAYNKVYIEVYYHNKKLYEFGNKYSPLWHAMMSLNLGTFYLKMDDLALAEEMYKKGISIFQKLPKQSEYGWLLHRLGELQRTNGDLVKAKKTLLKALDFWEQTNNLRGKSFTLAQLAHLFISLKQPDIAKQFFLEGLAITEKNNFWLSQISILFNLGKLNGQQKNHEVAIKYLEKSADLSIQKNISYYFKNNYQLLAENYAAIGKNQAANKNYQDYFNELEKSVKLNQTTTKEWAKNFDNLYAKEKAYNLLKETEINNQERLKLQQTIIAGALLIIALTLWIAFSYFQTNQRNAKQKDKLELLNQKIQEQANQLSIANKNITTQKNELQIELIKKLLVLSNHSESIKAIEHNLGQMDITKETLEIKKLLINTKDDSLWKELDIQLSQSNADFFEKLSKKHPNLTKGDLRLCAFLKMNLSTKEIANLTFKNPESVKVARSRLRKKLGLTHSNTVLSSFLNQI